MKTIAKRFMHGAPEGVIRNADSASRPAVQCRMFGTRMSETLGMKTMSVTGTMKAAVRRLASAAVGLAVVGALLGGVLVAASGSARAGGWTIANVSSGYQTVNNSDWDHWDENTCLGHPEPFGLSIKHQAYPLELDGSLTPTIVLTWHHADEANKQLDPAPPFVSVKIATSLISWWEEDNAGYPSYAQISKMTTNGGAADSTDRSPYADLPGGSVGFRSSRLLRIPAGCDRVVYPLPELKAHIKGGISQDYNWWGYLWVALDMSSAATIDSRDVMIHASVDPTYRKEPVPDIYGEPWTDEWGNQLFYPVKNLRDATGTLRGDIGIQDTSSFPSPLTSITYSGVLQGQWNTDNAIYEWSETARKDGASGTLGTTVFGSHDFIEDFSEDYLGIYKGRDGTVLDTRDVGRGDAVSLTFTDGQDGTTAKTFYSLNIHPGLDTRLVGHPEPIVNLKTATTNPDKFEGIGSGFGAPVEVTVSAAEAYDATNRADQAHWIGITLGVVGGFIAVTDPIAGAICATIGLTINELKTGKIEPKTFSFNDLWDNKDGLSTWNGNQTPALGREFYNITGLNAKAKYLDHWAYVDVYGPSGYERSELRNIVECTGFTTGGKFTSHPM